MPYYGKLQNPVKASQLTLKRRRTGENGLPRQCAHWLAMTGEGERPAPKRGKAFKAAEGSEPSPMRGSEAEGRTATGHRRWCARRRRRER